MNLESYGNDKYLLLKHFHEIEQIIDGKKGIITNKQNIADYLHFRKNKVIRLIDECIEDGVIEKVTSRGKYKITQRGYKLLAIFTETDI